MRASWIAPFVALCLAFATAAHAETKSSPSADADFVRQALKSGEEEVALATIAAERTQTGDLKQFAQMLISDHGAVNEQLRLLVRRNGGATTPPGGSTDGPRPPAAAPGAAPSSGKAAELRRLSGSAFDKTFLETIVEGHEKSVELYAAEAEKGGDPAAKKLATETLPKIKAHLQQAKSLLQAMEKNSR